MNRAARWLIGGASVHRLAETTYDLVMPLLVLSLTGSAVWMGVMFAAGFAAEFLVAVIGGGIVDRTDRKRLLLTVTGAEVLVMAACGTLALADGLTPPLLILAAAGIDFLVRLYTVADTAALPRIVSRDRLPRANGLMQAGVSTAQAIGPVLAGLVISLTDAGSAMLTTSVIFLLLFAVLTRIPSWGMDSPERAEEAPRQVLRHMWEGIRFTFTNPLYRQIAVWRGFFDFFVGAAFLMFMFYMEQELGFAGLEIGTATTFGAVGAISGGLIFSRVQGRLPSNALLTGLCAGMALAFAGMALADVWWSVGAVMLALMFQLSLISRLLTMLYQDTVPPDYVGRVTATSQLLTTGFGPLSVLTAAWAAEEIGVRYVFATVAVAVLVLAALSRLRAMGRADWRIREEVHDRSPTTEPGEA